ncbi:MAG: hypothetical protein GTN81_10785 [Proteobacteria bacterium]|nr:hypothetical protein [Pseudomonadota bacterium]
MASQCRLPRWAGPILRSDGTVLLELVVSSLILVVVIMAIGTFFMGHLTAFDRGKEQMELQRMGSLIMEGMIRPIREGSQVVGIVAGPSGAYRDIQVFYPGEPFFDANRNGVYDEGEDFIDIYQRDSDGLAAGFKGIWNAASGMGPSAVPTVYFGLDDTGPYGGTITKGSTPSDGVPWDILVSDATRGSLWFDKLEFVTPSGPGQSLSIAFTIRNDMGTNDQTDDISMDFSSSVNLRE